MNSEVYSRRDMGFQAVCIGSVSYTHLNRLNVLNGLLNVDKRENELVDGAPDEGDSVPVSKERAYDR